jgi:hypothetical protein
MIVRQIVPGIAVPAIILARSQSVVAIGEELRVRYDLTLKACFIATFYLNC